MKKILIPIDGSENSLEGIKLLKSLGVCKNNQIYRPRLNWQKLIMITCKHKLIIQMKVMDKKI